MRIRCGYTISFDCPQALPMQTTLSVHPSRRGDLETPDWIRTDPIVEVTQYVDGFGNNVARLTAPPGRITLTSDFVVRDTGLTDESVPDAMQIAIENLPDETLVYLLGSRYCETDKLSDIAWSLFHHMPFGWARVQAICDWVHNHIAFDYQQARPTKSAYDVYQEKTGVCRDYTHLAVAFCRCMNIPARYCTGYLGDIGVPFKPPMDFSAWFEVYLGGRWHTFDARNNIPRIGRILMGRGRDATDVAITQTFGPAILTQFDVVTDEIPS